jgi:hypothetical protein
MDSVVAPVMQSQVDSYYDTVVVPSVPVTATIEVDSTPMIETQIEKMKDMNKAGYIQFTSILDKRKVKKKDLMFMMTINAGVIIPDYFDRLVDAMIMLDEDEPVVPDHIGLKLMNVRADNPASVQHTLDFITFLAKIIQRNKSKIGKDIPIHILNQREFGYVTFAYGASTVSSPIATTNYFAAFDSENPPEDHLGKMYHVIDMADYPYKKMLAETRSQNYRPPCHCLRCQRETNLINTKPYFNEYRREHFVLAKNLEMIEIQEAPSDTLHLHLQQKFSRSKGCTMWIPYLDAYKLVSF